MCPASRPEKLPRLIWRNRMSKNGMSKSSSPPARTRTASAGRTDQPASRQENTIPFGERRLENDVANTQIRNIAIVGTGLIGASWAAQYLARGFDVIATDPAPNAEANLRKWVDEAWELLTVAGLDSGASRDRLTFSADLQQAVS